MSNMIETPKPCPFCGGKNIGWKWREAYSCDSSYAFFGCKDCGIGSDDASKQEEMHPEDVAAWNRRATPPEVTALVEALRVANVHVANNAQGWSVARSAAKADQAIINAALAKWEASQK